MLLFFTWVQLYQLHLSCAYASFMLSLRYNQQDKNQSFRVKLGLVTKYIR